MSAVEHLLDALEEWSSGHWSLVIGEQAPPFEELARTKRGENLLRGRISALEIAHFHAADHERLREAGTGTICHASALEEILQNKVKQAEEDRVPVVRLVVTGFGSLDLANQCTVLSGSRAVREKPSACKLQTVVCGTWNYSRFRKYWKDYSARESFALDAEDVYRQEALNAEAISGRLRKAEIIGSAVGDWERVCAALLAERTGGDVFLVDYIISLLRHWQANLDRLEAALREAETAARVRDGLLKRLLGLPDSALDLLEEILHRQMICRSESDPDVDELRLRGVVTTRHAPSCGAYVTVASPVVERVLRECWTWPPIKRPAIYCGPDIAQPCSAINEAAYRLVAQIETLLRNLVVLGLTAKTSENWSQRLDGVKTLAHGGESIAQEWQTLVRELRESILPVLGLAQPAIPTPAPDALPPSAAAPEDRKKLTQATLLSNAREWQGRSSRHAALSLDQPGIMCFFTTEGLVSVLANKKIYPEVVRQYFPQKDELATFLAYFVAIRAAVAHNQPVTLNAFGRLRSMRDELKSVWLILRLSLCLWKARGWLRKSNLRRKEIQIWTGLLRQFFSGPPGKGLRLAVSRRQPKIWHFRKECPLVSDPPG